MPKSDRQLQYNFKKYMESEIKYNESAIKKLKGKKDNSQKTDAKIRNLEKEIESLKKNRKPGVFNSYWRKYKKRYEEEEKQKTKNKKAAKKTSSCGVSLTLNYNQSW